MEAMARVIFTQNMDEELCKQAIVVDPFATTYDNLLFACKREVPELFGAVRSSKTLRDRLLLLLKKRSQQNAAEEKA